MDKLIAFFDERFMQDTFVVAYDKYQKWNVISRKAEQKVEDFISDYETVCREAENKGVKDFEVIKAFKLLDASCLEPFERQLVFTGVNFEVAKTKKDLYTQMKNAIKKFKGEQSKIIQGSSNERFDAVFLCNNEQVLAAHGYTKAKKKGVSNDNFRRMNPTNNYGEPYKCHGCGSIYHFIDRCPEKKGRRDKSTFKSSGREDFSLVSFDLVKDGMCLLLEETENMTVLDSACTATVAGRAWVEGYINGLNLKEMVKLKENLGERMFKFGGGVKKKSIKIVVLPVCLAGKEVTIATDVVDADIPLLISVESMKRAQIVVNFHTDEAIIMGRKVKLQKTSSGHLSLPLKVTDSRNRSGEIVLDEEVYEVMDAEECMISIESADTQERMKALRKLHMQMGHLPVENLIRTSGKWKPGMEKLIEDIESSCLTCTLLPRIHVHLRNRCMHHYSRYLVHAPINKVIFLY